MVTGTKTLTVKWQGAKKIRSYLEGRCNWTDERLNMVDEKKEESRTSPFLEIKNIGRGVGWGKLVRFL